MCHMHEPLYRALKTTIFVLLIAVYSSDNGKVCILRAEYRTYTDRQHTNGTLDGLRDQNYIRDGLIYFSLETIDLKLTCCRQRT
jgi:hypothetical protein